MELISEQNGAGHAGTHEAQKSPTIGGFFVLGFAPVFCLVPDDLAAVMPLHDQAFGLTFFHGFFSRVMNR